MTLSAWHLRSANHQLLAVPLFRLSTYCRRSFIVSGVSVWNSLPDFIDDPTISADCFRRFVKTYLFVSREQIRFNKTSEAVCTDSRVIDIIRESCGHSLAYLPLGNLGHASPLGPSTARRKGGQGPSTENVANKKCPPCEILNTPPLTLLSWNANKTHQHAVTKSCAASPLPGYPLIDP